MSLSPILRLCSDKDEEAIYSIINDAATAYRGIIPTDRYHEPYMSRDELIHEKNSGVIFWGAELDGQLIGVMGIQDKGEVALIRHAYVRTNSRQGGIGTKLLHHLTRLTAKPILIGTWEAAAWAIAFYEKNGFKQVPGERKTALLQQYWNVPERQIQTSVVLASANDWV
ncbi:GNAT family N-acetyltransferase [Paenibacillus sp. NFR01]|uniref:GNAT family N-acetyltransferase n=1 Tax=Paenibacillus sp. NFR01 TaxID=1566279 RepID=UPI0008AB2041|nr:GNAT family N-acetyltransferase [Paenibacillus sp. NFR01]SET22090.1 N-acetylglutamate synthase, GNAT family [Paenibacillus sp. NFR01]